MKLVLYTYWISPHLIPLARELAVVLGDENFKYLYTEDPAPHHITWGWHKIPTGTWCVKGTSSDSILFDCDVLLSGIRDLDLMEMRVNTCKSTYYMSERWFKPIPICCLFNKFDLALPGWVRLFVPKYFKMAKRLTRLLLNGDHFTYLPIGVHAAKDIALILKLFAGRNVRVGGVSYCPMDIVGSMRNIRMWGYFVDPGRSENRTSTAVGHPLHILWAGRMLHWKHVDTIVLCLREICRLADCEQKTLGSRIEVTLVGDGPERMRLERLARQLPVKFMHPQPIWRIRELMRIHDVYVLPSGQYEGWGAVVSEALEEGMVVLGTYEAGSTSTVLAADCLFHVGDYRTLAKLILRETKRSLRMRTQFVYTAREGALRLVQYLTAGK